MISGTHIGSNFRKYAHGTLPPLAMVAIMLIPLLFGGLFVWAYYDPIGNLNKIPVALVNSDQPATGPDGEVVNAGEEVVDSLMERRPLEFQLVSAEEAREGISDGTFYLGVEIPTDFSEAAVSVNSPTPHQAKLNITLNETNGFIPTLLGNQVATVMTAVVSDTISSQVVNQLFLGFNTIGDGIDQAAEGASELNNGASEAAEGGSELNNGTEALSGGARELDDGIQKLSDGAVKLDAGVGELGNGAQKLDSGVDSASEGADKLANGLTQLQSGTDELGGGASQVAGGVDRITSVASQLGQAQHAYDTINEALTQVISGLENSPIPGTEHIAQQARDVQAQLGGSQLAAALDPELLNQVLALQAGAHEVADQLTDPQAKYRSGVNEAVAGAQALSAGLEMLKEGSGTLVVGTATLKDGTSQLVVGANAASDGSSRLVEGADQLVVGAGQLGSGLVQLDDGSGELALKLSEGAEQAPRFEDERLDAATDVASTPVSANHTGDSLTFFGKGLSPFFLSLSLWLGGLALFMVFSPMSRRAIDSGVNPLRVLNTTLIPAFIIGLCQSVILWLVQVVAIGLEPSHPVEMFGILWLISWVFISVITTINVVFGPSAGRLVTIAAMSVQLVASNGLYPPEVQPEFIQWLHKYDPMRFSVDLLRFALFGTREGDPRMLDAVIVLVLIAVGAWVISCLGLWKHRVIMAKDVHPEIEV